MNKNPQSTLSNGSPASNLSITPRGLRVADAAYAGVTHWHLRTAVWTGKLKAYRAGKCIIILRDDLDEYLKSLPEVQLLKSRWLTEREAKAKVSGGVR